MALSPTQTTAPMPTSGAEPTIFTMPAAYRFGAAGPLTAPKVDATKTITPPKPTPTPPAPKKVPLPTGAPIHGKSSRKIAVLVGILIILLLGIIGFFVVHTLTTSLSVTPAPTTSLSTPTSPVSVPTPTPVPPTPVVPTSPLPVTAPQPGIDSDSDGLTDVEKTTIYHLDLHLPDANGSGYLNGNDVFNLYDPKVPPAPGCTVDCTNTLRAYGITKPFDTSFVAGAPSLPYVIDYPSIWSPSAVVGDPLGVMFTTTTGETISVDVKAKTSSTQTLTDWYAAQNLSGGQAFVTKGGLNAISSADQLTVYVDAKTNVLVLTYNLQSATAIEYLTTFKMMQNSLKIK